MKMKVEIEIESADMVRLWELVKKKKKDVTKVEGNFVHRLVFDIYCKVVAAWRKEILNNMNRVFELARVEVVKEG